MGVVGRVKAESLREQTGTPIQAYFPIAQSWMAGNAMALVKTALPRETVAASARTLAARLDPEQPVFAVETSIDMRNDDIATERLIRSPTWGLLAVTALGE